ncbi:DNA polymerase III subunit psi [Avibacterium sp. 21-586]|uniref:DNA polymerase III subunit psi n=1 Tax=Avibacterium sp. 21-586 TaxID=2911534 RepID=UPI00224745EE|nr:DNA polymerase III subunit psi [Avibacterium sp. 21-586]MCW9710025.1 DNA polymerase III subunit psi [Avibacterium sp. 21-586]
MKRHQLLLQEMGLTQWQLTRPERLQGIVNIPIEEQVRLVIISEIENIPTLLLQDILHSLEFKLNEHLAIHFDFIPHLLVSHKVHYWLLSENLEKIHRTLPYCQKALSLWLSPSWETFMTSPQEKRKLWQQIQGITA